MNLRQVRRQFVTDSGREDLINEDGSDRGADKYIQAAADWLDENMDHPKSTTRHVELLSSGSYYLHLPRCQTVEQVWIMGEDVDGQYIRRQLSGPRSAAWIRHNYNEKWSEQSQDTPTDYSLDVIGLEGSQVGLESTDLSSYDDVDDLLLADDSNAPHYKYTGMLFVPVADQEYTLSVFGKFYQKELTTDTDQNYWTVVKPLILSKAACRLVEGALRNFQGEQDFLKSIEVDMRALDKSFADQTSAGLLELNG